MSLRINMISALELEAFFCPLQAAIKPQENGEFLTAAIFRREAINVST